MTIDDADLALLRRFEPILTFTQGELFFPMATGPFVEACDLLEGPTLREARVAIPSERLDLERLGAEDDPPPGHSQYLRSCRNPCRPWTWPAGGTGPVPPSSMRRGVWRVSGSPLGWWMPAS